MKTVIHPSKEVLVVFPNGKLRYRNCHHTVIPDNALSKNSFPANRDLRIQAALQSIQCNRFREKVNQEIRQNEISITWMEIIIGLAALLLTILCVHL